MNEWDTIVQEGWAPDHAAGIILCYLRGSLINLPLEERDLSTARWFYQQLLLMGRGELLSRVAQERKSGRTIFVGRANAALVRLKEILTREEREALTSG